MLQGQMYINIEFNFINKKYIIYSLGVQYKLSHFYKVCILFIKLIERKHNIMYCNITI